MQTALLDVPAAPRPLTMHSLPTCLAPAPQRPIKRWRRVQARGHVRLARTLLAACERGTSPPAAERGRRLHAGLDATLAVFDETDDWAVMGLACLLRLSLRECNRRSEARLPAAALRRKRKWAVPMDVSVRAWRCEDARLMLSRKDRAVASWPRIVAAVDALIEAQVARDLAAIQRASGRRGDFGPVGRATIAAEFRSGYRWRVLGIGARSEAFRSLLDGLATPAQRWWLERTLAPFCCKG